MDRKTHKKPLWTHIACDYVYLSVRQPYNRHQQHAEHTQTPKNKNAHFDGNTHRKKKLTRKKHFACNRQHCTRFQWQRKVAWFTDDPCLNTITKIKRRCPVNSAW